MTKSATCGRCRILSAVSRSGARLTLDPVDQKVTLGDNPLLLTRTEFALLSRLMRESPQPISRARLLEDIWGVKFHGSNVVDVYIAYLRGRLGEGFIETVRGQGYAFAALEVA